MKGFKDSTKTQWLTGKSPGPKGAAKGSQVFAKHKTSPQGKPMAFAKGGLVKAPPKAAAAAPKAAAAPVVAPAKGTSSSTSTEVKSPTSTKTSTVADTQGNITVTGGAGAGNTVVHIGVTPAAKYADTGRMKVRPRGPLIGS